MNPKEKAKDLVSKFLPFVDSNDLIKDCKNEQWAIRNAKRSALVAVDELLKLANLMDGGFSFEKEIIYWQEVKNELEKL